MQMSIDSVIARFESQLGVTEDPFGSNYVLYNDWYYGRHWPGPWCATFVSWCFHHEGLPLPASTSKGFAYTPSGAAWFQKQSRWTTTPKRGSVVFFDFPNDGVNRISHVGIVTGVRADGSIDTIEGNTDESGSRTGGKVMRRRRSVGIVGYGVPEYSVVKPTPIPIPTPKEAKNMLIVWRKGATNADAFLLVGDGQKKVAIPTMEDISALKGAGVIEIPASSPLSSGLVDAIPSTS